MSSSDRLSPMQLAMFMPARELHVQDDPETGYPDRNAPLHPGDFLPGSHGTYGNLWKQKLAEAQRDGRFQPNPHYDPDNPLTSDEVDAYEGYLEREEEPPPELTREEQNIFVPKESLQQSIAKAGVRDPVPIAFAEDLAAVDRQQGRTPKDYLPGQKVTVDGHHRIAAAYDLNPDTEVPVEYRRSSPMQDE